jgi:ABC-type lipoprotein export system ATPase subunit
VTDSKSDLAVLVPLASAEALCRFHGPQGSQTPVLRGVSLRIAPREFVCVMGPSGSGKSSLLHLLSGLDTPSGGEVELGGTRLKSLSDEARTLARREQVGYVFQFFHLLPNFTVRENIGLPLAIRGENPERNGARIDALLERLGLAHKANSFPHELSGGEMQRTSIARALIGGQPLLLCDEPTGNLSQKAGAEVMALLRECVDKEGRSVLLVTHNPRDAVWADRVLFLVDGLIDERVQLSGPHSDPAPIHKALGSLGI